VLSVSRQSIVSQSLSAFLREGSPSRSAGVPPARGRMARRAGEARSRAARRYFSVWNLVRCARRNAPARIKRCPEQRMRRRASMVEMGGD